MTCAKLSLKVQVHIGNRTDKDDSVTFRADFDKYVTYHPISSFLAVIWPLFTNLSLFKVFGYGYAPKIQFKGWNDL